MIMTLEELNQLKHDVVEVRGMVNRGTTVLIDASNKLKALEKKILDLAIKEETG